MSLTDFRVARCDGSSFADDIINYWMPYYLTTLHISYPTSRVYVIKWQLFRTHGRGGLEVELWTDNSFSSALVDQIRLGAMYLYGTIWTRYIYKVYRCVLYVCVSPQLKCNL